MPDVTTQQFLQSTCIVAPEHSWPALITELAQEIHPGDFFVSPTLTSNPSVSLIKEVHQFLRISSISGKGRVVVLHRAESFTKEVANALLKTLEEPPEGTKIVLLATRDSLLPTIRSRVTVLSMKVPSPEVAWKSLAASYQKEQAEDRAMLLATLQLSPLLHAGIRSDTLGLLHNPQ